MQKVRRKFRSPALVIHTLYSCIVFLPMAFLSGVAKYLFVPLRRKRVVFRGILALVCLGRERGAHLAMYLLRAKQHNTPNP